MKAIKVVGAALALYVLAGNSSALAQGARNGDHWVGTWATAVVARLQGGPGNGQLPPQAPQAPQALQAPPALQPQQALQPPQGRAHPPPLNFNNQTLRQIVHTSIGGDRVRVVLSNAFGTSPVSVGAANVALRQKEAAIVP